MDIATSNFSLPHDVIQLPTGGIFYKNKKKSPKHIEAVRTARLNSPKSKGHTAWNKGLPSPMKGKSLGPKPILTCLHCGLSGGTNAMKRYHFDNCRYKSGKSS